MPVELGLIEGFYGPPWSWAERTATLAFLAPHGYRSYLYAPKGDAFLRRRWQEPHAPETAERLAALAAHCRSAGIRFGIGLSPYDAFRDFDATARAALARKLAFCDELAVEDLAILFDDMRGDVPRLAERQAELVEWAASRTGASRLMVCPSYYSDDPLLDRIFGARPDGYLHELGRRLDPAIEIFWTGTAICARTHEPADFARIAEELGRRPRLWDNYPVNDTARMSQHLHLRGFTGRPAALAEHISGHAINGALQPTLTRIPALTLLQSYREGSAYAPERATLEAATAVLGAQLGAMLVEDVALLQDVGLDALGEHAGGLRTRYAAVDHAGAREVVAWLDGAYRVTDELVRSQ
ncbi:MAG TPA: beta-N-acetylglucosaminidase domain-containing protein [Longimicrobiales bacterium]|nr:beta-N-acetylglucosaminidase domain-containing protein [Longimicrobiales bacterium]